MHELVPKMAEAMQLEWNKSKAGPPEQHAQKQETTPMFNQWFGADMEPKEEGTDAAVESVFEVLAGACSIRTNPDPSTDPKPDPNPGTLGSTLTRLVMEGKGVWKYHPKGLEAAVSPEVLIGPKGLQTQRASAVSGCFQIQIETKGHADTS